MHKQLLNNLEDVFVVRNFLSPEECEHYVALSESIGYGDAPINTFGGPVVNKSMRNNERVMLDDPALAARLWERLRPFVAPKRGTHWHAVGLNERLRFYRYDPGQRFDWHFDGAFERSPTEQSALTFMVYLNDAFAGGATEFNFRLTGAVLDDDAVSAVVPEAGMALVFYHRILHQGAPVTRGRKYVLRSDVMYRWQGE
jgi:predicted 2-oxoglutarate/Fe(II)-dependent dioxygenase YbiX